MALEVMWIKINDINMSVDIPIDSFVYHCSPVRGSETITCTGGGLHPVAPF